MRTFLTLLLLVIALPVFSQKKLLHFGIGTGVKSTSLHFITNDSLGEAWRKLSYSLMGHVFLNISPRFQLVSGLGLHQLNFDFKDYSPEWPCDLDGKGGVLIYNSWWEETYSMRYIGLPLEGRLKLTGKKSHLYLQFGVEKFFKIKSDEEIFSVKCKTNKHRITSRNITSEPTFNLLLLKSGIVYGFPVAQSVKLFLFPSFEYAAATLWGYRRVNSRLTNLSLAAGIRFMDRPKK